MKEQYFDKYKFTSSDAARDLYLNGFVHLGIKEGETQKKLLQLLKELRDEPKEGFKWVEKYPSSFDLYPNTYSYDDIFLDFLFSQGLPQKVKDCTGAQLYLGDVIVRVTYPGTTYMSWHRDTYKYGKAEGVGRFPAMHKIIFYPDLDNKKYSQIQLSAGSHRKITSNKYIDKARVYLRKKETIFSSNSEAIFFESSLFHNPLNPGNENGSYRIIYNFVYESQLSQFKGREDLHAEYKRRLALGHT